MTPTQFVLAVERQWIDRHKSPEKTGTYVRKLQKFSEKQLDEIFDGLLERCDYFPKLADIWAVAGAMGYIGHGHRRNVTSRTHSWEPTDCPMCGGEGRLSVYCTVTFGRGGGEGLTTSLRPERVFPLTSQENLDFQAGTDMAPFAYRCSCPAGKAPTIGKWPVFQGGAQVGLSRVDPIKPKPRDFQRAHEIVDDGLRKPKRRLPERELEF